MELGKERLLMNTVNHVFFAGYYFSRSAAFEKFAGTNFRGWRRSQFRGITVLVFELAVSGGDVMFF